MEPESVAATPSKSLVLALAALVLAGSIVLFLPLGRATVAFAAPKPLKRVMLACPPDWAVMDRAVGDTEIATNQAESMLRYDDAFVRVYTKGSVEVIVYVAYWSPGQMDPRLILAHTPDTCWIYDGAKMRLRDDHRTLPGVGAARLRPAYFRSFDWPDQRTEVVFWHIYGGEPSEFPLDEASPDQAAATQGPGPLGKMINTLRATGFGTIRKDQVFVRISTNGTIADLVRSDLWPSLVASLSATGIADPKSG